jgi:polyisoprenoid-binding protein YceI
LGAAPTEGDSVAATAVGDLTLHGVTNSISMALEGSLVGGTMVVVGSTEVALTDYGIEAPTGFSVLTIEEVGTIEVQLAFVRS